jgi:asparagine synthase (glutamine-hydrolysing)
MAALAGVVDERAESAALKRLVERMCAVVSHRPGQAVVVSAREQSALGRVCPEHSDPECQMAFSRDGSLSLVIEGELYDREDLQDRLGGEGDPCLQRLNDAAFILALFERHGTDFVDRLNGSFCFAVWDARNRSATLVNDRYGLRPLFYSNQGGRFSFCTEVKGILQDPAFRRRVDERSVADFFSFQLITGDRTLLEDVTLLPNASVLTWKGGRVSIRRYWDIDFREGERKLTESEYVERLGFLVRQAVQRRCRDDCTKGVFLSGGLDSRIVLDALATTVPAVHSFTTGMSDAHDVRFARQLARAKGSTHHYEELTPAFLPAFAEKATWLSDGMCSCEHTTILSLLETAKKHCTVVFDGLASDALIGGLYVRKEMLGDGQRDGHFVESVYGRMARVFPEDEWRDIFVDDYYERVKGAAMESIREVARDAPAERAANQNDYVYFKTRQRRFIFFGPIMTRTQLECRTPYYDNDLVDFAYRIPASMKLGKRLHVRMVRECFPGVATVPWSFSGLPVVSSTPTRLLARRALYRGERELRDLLYRVSGGRVLLPYRRDFKDVALWLRTTCADWARDLILGSRLTERGYFRRTSVRELVDAHMSAKTDHTHRLCTLITFELWNRMFID